MTILVEESAIKRINHLRTQQNQQSLRLRVTVNGGGCSGFQYKLTLTGDLHDDDEIFEDCIITDPVSFPFLTGSTISFEESLIGSEFKINNPNAVSGCGCGTSFAV